MIKSEHMRSLKMFLFAAALLGATACDSILEVENPGDVTEEALQSEEALPVLVNGVYGDLQDAYDNLVLTTGIFTDELAHSGSFPTFAQYDNRSITTDNVSLLGFFADVSTARFSADQAIATLRTELEDPASDPLLAEALALGGYARLFLADNFCQVTLDAGPPLEPQVVYQQAEELFTEAIQVAGTAGDDVHQNLALVGRARTRLNLGNNAGAIADAAMVPDDFVFLIEYALTSGRENNEVTVFTVSRREASIGEPFWNDPRIPQCSVHPASTVAACTFAIEGELGPDNETPLFVQLLYPTQESPIPLATGVEANLIEAEASGQDVSEEKAFALFLRGSRLADLRRRNDPFLAGGDTCFPFPLREIDTNPNL
ncbi:MAG TPA: hypothetical protein VM737_07480 [Gemmatimonadota bacterium]|nr:hypothetical protein [Gemmatimonadota bacterium]